MSFFFSPNMVQLVRGVFMANRTITREKAMTVLYQTFLYKKNKINYELDDVIDEVVENVVAQERKKIDLDFLSQLCHGVSDNLLEIDKYIYKYLENWTLDRLGLTDQAIFRIAVYELIYTDTPSLVCINEAIELAKKYSDERVVKMINGVLDKIYHERDSHE